MKNNILRDAILGGFFGLILTKLGEYVYLLSTVGITSEMLEEIMGYLIIYLVFAFWFGLFSVIYHKKNNDSESMKPEEREKVLKKSRIYLIIVEFLSIIFAITSFEFKAPIQFTILIIAISLSILVWLVGAHLGYLDLKNRNKDKK